MILKDFLKMWQMDGTRLIKEEEKSSNGYKFILYGVYYPNWTSEYGRHCILVLKVDRKTQKILAHDIRNIQGENASLYTDWFDESLEMLEV